MASSSGSIVPAFQAAVNASSPRAARTAATSRWCASRKAGSTGRPLASCTAAAAPNRRAARSASCHRPARPATPSSARATIRRSPRAANRESPSANSARPAHHRLDPGPRRPSRRRRSRSPIDRQQGVAPATPPRIVTRPAGGVHGIGAGAEVGERQTATDPGQRPVIQLTGPRQRLLEVLGRLCEPEAVHRREAEAEPAAGTPLRVGVGLGDGQALGEAILGPLHIALIHRQVTKREEHFAPQRRRRFRAPGQGPFQPGPPLRIRAAKEPPDPKGMSHPEEGLWLAGMLEPLQGRPQVVLLGRQTVEPAIGPAASEIPFRFLGEVQVKGRVRGAHQHCLVIRPRASRVRTRARFPAWRSGDRCLCHYATRHLASRCWRPARRPTHGQRRSPPSRRRRSPQPPPA